MKKRIVNNRKQFKGGIGMKYEIEKAMREHLISSSEVEGAIEFVRDLLELNIEDTKTHEPYATRSMHEMRIAIQQIMSLYNFLDKYK
jgi:hypothetical protein